MARRICVSGWDCCGFTCGHGTWRAGNGVMGVCRVKFGMLAFSFFISCLLALFSAGEIPEL
jgi:hypothetical protein